MIQSSTKRIQFFILGLVTIHLTNSVLQIINTVQSEYPSHYFTSISPQPSHIVSLNYDGTALTNQYTSSQSPYLGQKSTFHYPNLPNPTQVRSWVGNSNPTNATFMYFNQNNLFNSMNATINFSNPALFFLGNNEIIVDVIYGKNASQQFILTKNQSNMTFKLYYNLNGIMPSSHVVFEQSHNSNYRALKCFSDKNIVILVLSKFTYVLRADQTLALLLIWNGVSYTSQYHGVDVSPGYMMALMHPEKVLLFNLSNISTNLPSCYQMQVFIGLYSTDVTGVKFISDEELLISTSMHLIRYNITSQSNTELMYYPHINYYSLAIVNNNIAIVYAQNRPSYAYYFVCLVESCFVPAPVPAPAKLPGNYFQSVNNQSVRSFSTTMANSVAFCSLKITPSMLTFLTNMVDDIWFYKYHVLKNRQSYPSTVEYFLQEVDFIGYLKSNPSFIRVIGIFSESTVAIQENQNLIQYFNFTREDHLQKVYFLNASQDTYKSNLFMNVVLFGIVKLFHLLLYYLQSRWNNFKDIYHAIKLQSKWWTLIIGIIQVNMAKLSFQAAVQFQFPSFTSSFDKVNLIIPIAVVFHLILYSLCFYPLNYTFTKKNERIYTADILLIRCKSEFKSFIFEPFLVIFRNFFRSFIHGYFIFFHSHQILILLLTDIIYIAVIFKMRNSFKHFTIFYLTFAYNLFYLAFDGYFTIQQMFDQFKSPDSRQLFGLVVILSIFVISLLLSFLFFILSIIQLVHRYIEKKVCQKINKIITRNSRIRMASIENQNEVNSNHVFLEIDQLDSFRNKETVLKSKKNQQSNGFARKNRPIKKQILVMNRIEANPAIRNGQQAYGPINVPSRFRVITHMKMKNN